MERFISTLIENSIAEKVCPGAVVYVFTSDVVHVHKAFGNRAVVPKRLPMHRNTLFDLASLTKPIVTATLCMQLVESGTVALDTPACAYLPAFQHPRVTLRHLLTHTSGLPDWSPVYLGTDSPEQAVAYLGTLPLVSPPGEKALYSCLGYIALGALITKVTGEPLDSLAQSRIFAPLHMTRTCFTPPPAWHDNCAATESGNSFERRKVNYARYDWREGIIVGQVHDENAHFLGGVSGNAGLFSTAADVAKFCRMLMETVTPFVKRHRPSAAPRRNSTAMLSPESLTAMRTLYPAAGEPRSIGWRIMQTDGSLYHTGFTGTSLRICLKRNLAAILLTNRVHPDADREGILPLRKAFYELVFGGTHG